jgi:hypothetical protein
MYGYTYTSNLLYKIEVLGEVKTIKDNWLYYFLNINTPVDLDKSMYYTEKYRIIEVIDINNNNIIKSDEINNIIDKNISFYKNKTQAFDNFSVEYYFNKIKDKYVKKDDVEINFSGIMRYWTCIGTIETEFYNNNGTVNCLI